MSSADRTPLAQLKVAVAACYSPTNAPPSEAVAVEGAFQWDAGASLDTALATSNLVIILGSDSTPRTISTDAVDSPVADGTIIRVANGADPASGQNITIQDTAGTPEVVAIIAAGEVVRLQFFADAGAAGANARWLKIPGV